VLNANYIAAGLKDVLDLAFDGTCMHEALFTDDGLKDTGVTTLDIAKALIDEDLFHITIELDPTQGPYPLQSRVTTHKHGEARNRSRATLQADQVPSLPHQPGQNTALCDERGAQYKIA